MTNEIEDPSAVMAAMESHPGSSIESPDMDPLPRAFEDSAGAAASSAPSGRCQETKQRRATRRAVAILQHDRIAFADSGVVAISGLSEPELRRLTPDELRSMLHPEDRETVCRYLRGLASSPTEVVDDMECRVVGTDGSETWLDLSASSLDYRGEAAVQVAIFDVTDRKVAQGQAERCESLLGALKSTGRELAASSQLDATLNAVLRSTAAVVNADDVHMCVYSDDVGLPDNFYRLARGAEDQPPAVLASSQHHGGTIAAVPLRGSGTVLGVMNVVFGQPRVLSDEEMCVLDLLAGQAGAAVYSASLLTRLNNTLSERDRSLAEQAALLGGQLAEVSEAERAASAKLAELEEALVETRSTNGRLGRLQAELESFTASVAHHLRSPLRALQGFSEALREDYSSELDLTGRLYTERIGVAVQRLDARLAGLQALSQMGSANLRLRDVPLDDIVDEVLIRLDVQRHYPQAQISVQGPLPVVAGDRHVLLTVVENLVSNALRFVPADVEPQVRIWGETFWMGPEKETVQDSTELTSEARSEASPQHWARLWVSDNGLGIPAEHHDRVFGVFERLHGLEGLEGAGVGLALVKKGVERLGGEVGFQTGSGVGSRFCVMLPAAAGAGEPGSGSERGAE